MKNKKLVIIIVASVALSLLIGALAIGFLFPSSPVGELMQDMGIIDPPTPECYHIYEQYSLIGTPTYTTSATLERTCSLCKEKQSQSFYASSGLTYETDDEGTTYITGADGFTGNVLYISSKQKDGSPVHGIGESVFSETAIEIVFIEEGIRAISDYAFALNKSLKEVHLPASLTEYGSYTFSKCEALKNVVWAEGTTKLGGSQFYECTSLTDIVLPDGIVDIPLGVFYGCSNLTNITLPKKLVNLGAEVFSACTKLTNLELPSTLKQIYPNCFAGCTSLTTFTIPALDKLHFSAFLGCTGLKTVFLSGGIKEIQVNGADGPFCYCSSDLVLYTDAPTPPSGWAKHFENYDSNVIDEDGGELNDDAYHNLKVVYNCPLSEFPG